jgi:hypothetical protein
VIAASAGVQGGSISTALPSTLSQLPWSIDQVSLQFSEAVTVGPNDLAVTGIGGTQYAISTSPTAFSYDAATRTATWTLATPVVADQVTLSLAGGIADRSGNVLDGETTVTPGGSGGTVHSLPSGNSVAGGDFQLQFSVLTGDYTQDGVVNFVDVVAVRNLIGTASTLADLDRDGIVSQNDMVRTMIAALMTPQLPSFPSTPPSPSPAAPAPAVDAAVTSIAREETRSASSLSLRSVSRRRDVAPASVTDEAIGEISREPTARRIRRR